MIGGIGLDMRKFRQHHSIMPVDKGSAEFCDRAAVFQGSRPEPPDVLTIGPLFLVEQAEWAGKGLAEGNASCGEPFSDALNQVIEQVSAPGEAASVRRVIAGGGQVRMPFSEILFDRLAEV